MEKLNKYCLPTPDAISFEIRNPFGVSINYIIFDAFGLNRNEFFPSSKRPFKNVEFFGSLSNETIGAFTVSNPLKISAIQIEWDRGSTPVLQVTKGRIDGVRNSENMIFESKKKNTQFQDKILMYEKELIIDSKTSINFDVPPNSSIMFTFFIEEILTC